MKRLKEKAKAIWHIIKGGQYAVFVINNGYVNKKTTPQKTACLISDNASDIFLESIVNFTDRYRTDRFNKERNIIMIKGKTKYYTDVQVLGGNTIRVCNRNKGSFLFSGNPQIHIIDEDGYSMCTYLLDGHIDELIEVLQSAKKMVEE